MLTIKRHYGMANVKYIVWDSKSKVGDLTDTLSNAIRIYLWRLGVPARIAFYKCK